MFRCVSCGHVCLAHIGLRDGYRLLAVPNPTTAAPTRRRSPEIDLDSTINVLILQALSRRKKTQNDLAEFLHISHAAVSRRISSGYSWSLIELLLIDDWLRTNLVAQAQKVHRAAAR